MSSNEIFDSPYIEYTEPEEAWSSDTARDRSLTIVVNALNEHLNIDSLALQSGTKPHHVAALYAIHRNLTFGHKRGYVESATSTGKTFYIAKLTAAFDSSSVRTLILTHSLDQADQIVGINGDKGLAKFTSIDPAKVGKHFGGNKATKDHSIVISTYAGMNNFASTGELGEFDVILADEAHRSLGRLTSQRLIEFSPSAIKIGFTATPDYSADKKSEQVFERPFHRLKLREAIEEGVVAPIQALIYKTDQDIPLLDKREDFSDKELERLIHLKARNDMVVEVAKNFVSDERQGIISCLPGANLLHARMIAEWLNGSEITMLNGSKKRIRAEAVGSHEPQSMRREKLAGYERGEIDVLTFVNSIAEGWDSEQASFLINACPTTSIVKITQLIGRVLRRKNDGRESIVVDFIDNALKEQATALAALDEERFLLTRVIGVYDEPNKTRIPRETYFQRVLSAEIYDNIASSNAMLLSELHLKVSQQDPQSRLIAQYESILAAEGLTPEPINELKVPINTIAGISKFIRQYRRRYGLDPSQADVEEHINAANYGSAFEAGLGRQRLANLALNGFKVESYGITVEDVGAPDIDEGQNQKMENTEEADFRNSNIREALSSLPEREQLVLLKRFEFEGKKFSLDEIGEELNLSRTRVGQLERQALSRLSSVLSPDGSLYLHDRDDLQNRLEFAIQSNIEKRLGFVDYQLYVAKLDAIRVAYAKKNAMEDSDQPETTKDEVIYRNNLYVFIKKLYALAPKNMEFIENRKADDNTALVEGKVETWMPHGFEDDAQKARMLKEMLAYIDYNRPSFKSVGEFNRWIRLALVNCKSRIEHGTYSRGL